VGEVSGIKMASGKQQETDLDCQDAAAKNVNETSTVHVQGQNWPLAVDIGPPISANSSLRQQLSSAGASSTGHPFPLVNQPDASQGSLHHISLVKDFHMFYYLILHSTLCPCN
jgi:hypothetical protein